MEKHFRLILLVLLVGILAALVAIYFKLPSPAPTYGDYMKALENEESDKQVELLKSKCQMVYVDDGIISVDGSVDVTGTVDIGNTPLEVETN